MDENADDDEVIKPTRSVFRLLVKFAFISAVVGFLVVLLTLLNNNYSLRRVARSEFRERLDRSIEASTNWLSARNEFFGNPALMFMVVDMEKLSGDRRLRGLLDAYRKSEFVTDTTRPLSAIWARMAGLPTPVPTLDFTAVPAHDIVEILWDAYAVAPDKVMISRAQRENMFSATRFSWGRRTHQLLALDMFRYYNGGSADLDRTLNHLAEKVARDARFDFRVNDSYPQRSAFILAAGRPDLVRPRWIVRLLAYQHPDGSWSSCWYHWCKGVLEFRAQDVDPAHATVQAAWLLYMLKYRYPQWIDQHYQ